MSRICLLLASVLSWALASEDVIVAVTIFNPNPDRLSDAEVQAYNEFATQMNVRQRSLRSRALRYNCCSYCEGYKSPGCLTVSNGYCSDDSLTKCRYDVDSLNFGYRGLSEEANAEVKKINSGLGCEMAKKEAMEALVKTLREKAGSTEAALESLLDGIVLSCYAAKADEELISSFSLWDATTDTLVTDNIGDSVQLCQGFHFNVEAVVSAREKVEKVKFELHGFSGPIYERVEHQWRYMLYGDRDNKVIYGDSLMEPGTYMLRVTPNDNSMQTKSLYIRVNSCDQKDD